MGQHEEDTTEEGGVPRYETGAIAGNGSAWRTLHGKHRCTLYAASNSLTCGDLGVQLQDGGPGVALLIAKPNQKRSVARL
jgi:hypothetical protein